MSKNAVTSSDMPTNTRKSILDRASKWLPVVGLMFLLPIGYTIYHYQAQQAELQVQQDTLKAQRIATYKAYQIQQAAVAKAKEKRVQSTNIALFEKKLASGGYKADVIADSSNPNGVVIYFGNTWKSTDEKQRYLATLQGSAKNVAPKNYLIQSVL